MCSIITKNLLGVGNSLKFRVKSEEVRVGGSSWRLRSFFSFILSIIFALGAVNGAWATTTTYYQVKEKQDCTAIKIDGIASDVEIGYEPQLAFPGKTLDEINHYTLITELDGGEGDNTVTARATAWGIYPQRHKTNGSVDVLAYQFGVYEDGAAKEVILVLTNGVNGVYVHKFGWCNKEGSVNSVLRTEYCTLSNDGIPSFRNATGSGTSGGYKAWG